MWENNDYAYAYGAPSSEPQHAKVLLAVGSPVDGFQYIGPFDDYDSASNYGEKHYPADSWWAINLTPPLPNV